MPLDVTAVVTRGSLFLLLVSGCAENDLEKAVEGAAALWRDIRIKDAFAAALLNKAVDK